MDIPSTANAVFHGGRVLTLDGATEGLKVYLLPDFSKALEPKLIIAALGAAFFSLSLGVGTMLIYGSYISDKENLPVVGGLACLFAGIFVLIVLLLALLIRYAFLWWYTLPEPVES